LEREELEKILASLLQKAKSNKNSIDLGEVQEAVKEFSLNEEQMEQVLLLLENKGIEINPILDEDALKTIEKDGDKAEPDALLPLEDDDDFVKEEEGEMVRLELLEFMAESIEQYAGKMRADQVTRSAMEDALLRIEMLLPKISVNSELTEEKKKTLEETLMDAKIAVQNVFSQEEDKG